MFEQAASLERYQPGRDAGIDTNPSLVMMNRVRHPAAASARARLGWRFCHDLEIAASAGSPAAVRCS